MTSPGGMMMRGPPYQPTTWSLGGAPEKKVDIPITAVFLALFVVGAATHMTIFQLNNRRQHKFIFSVLMFGFCMSRIVTCILRIASVSLPTNLRLAIAAQVFVSAGVLLLFVINLIWTQRVLRSMHPGFGWHYAPSMVLKALYAIIVLTLAIVITATIQSFYTLRPRTKKIDRDLQLYAATCFTIISFIPIPAVLLALAIPRRSSPEKFGAGRHRTKLAVLLTGVTVLCLGAAYRCGTSWLTPVPRTQPLPAYFHKACFYMFNFGVEIITVYLYGIMRVDLRFHIPDGARGPGSYTVRDSGKALDGSEVEEGKKETTEAAA